MSRCTSAGAKTTASSASWNGLWADTPPRKKRYHYPPAVFRIRTQSVEEVFMVSGNRLLRVLLSVSLLLLAVPLLAQQTGEIAGKVTGVDGSSMPGVTVEARSNVLPQARVTTTSENGDYRLPVLPPGAYTVTFSLAGMQTVTRNTTVVLNQTASVNVA